MVHICQLEYKVEYNGSIDHDIIKTDEMALEEEYIYGQSGCGLCSIDKLKAAGVDYLKIVGRGASVCQMETDIRLTKKVLDIRDQDLRRKTIFSNECSKNCYYLRAEEYAL